MSQAIILTANNVKKKYDSLQVLKGIDLQVKKGEIISIVGSSGAGKSTLLHILGTLDEADSGNIVIGDENISLLKEKKLSAFRNQHLGFVFQFHHLLPEFSAIENVCIPGWIAKRKTNELKKRAYELLDVLGIVDRAEHKPQFMSGGEQQRVAVARALINNPDIIFADEPTGNLDTQHATELHDLFRKLSTEFNQTFIIVTHNEELASKSNRILHMKDGLFI